MKHYKSVMIALGCALLMCVLLFVDLITKAWAEWYDLTYSLNQPGYFLGIIKLTYTKNMASPSGSSAGTRPPWRS